VPEALIFQRKPFKESSHRCRI